LQLICTFKYHVYSRHDKTKRKKILRYMNQTCLIFIYVPQHLAVYLFCLFFFCKQLLLVFVIYLFIFLIRLQIMYVKKICNVIKCENGKIFTIIILDAETILLVGSVCLCMFVCLRKPIFVYYKYDGND
jgi:hypothetical protein